MCSSSDKLTCYCKKQFKLPAAMGFFSRILGWMKEEVWITLMISE